MMSLPGGDGARVALECMLVADLKILSQSLITLDQFEDIRWGQEVHQCQALHCKADVRDIGATLPSE